MGVSFKEVWILRNKLKAIRMDKGFTQQEISDLVGIDRSFYTNIELGVKNPSLLVALKIKEVLNYSDDDIFLTTNVA